MIVCDRWYYALRYTDIHFNFFCILWDDHLVKRRISWEPLEASFYGHLNDPHEKLGFPFFARTGLGKLAILMDRIRSSHRKYFEYPFWCLNLECFGTNNFLCNNLLKFILIMLFFKHAVFPQFFLLTFTFYYLRRKKCTTRFTS